MSHEIEQTADGQACIAWNGETPWHGLGFDCGDDKITAQQMAAAAHADWEVELRPTYAEVKIDGKTKRIPARGYRALVRKDLVDSEPERACLTVTGKSWHPIQNSEAFSFFDDYVKKGKLKMNVVGSLRGGQLVWALARCDGDFALFRGRDQIETYVLFHNPHEYGKSGGVLVTPTRVVCRNTLALSLSGRADSVFHSRITHRKVFNAEEIKTQLDVVHARMKEYKEKAEFLAKRLLNPVDFKEYCEAVFPTKSTKDEKVSRMAQTAFDVLEKQPGAELGAGTWWQGFNAITFTFDHLSGQQYKAEDSDVPMRDRRLTSNWFGYGARRKMFALDKAVAYAEKAKAARA